LNDPDADVTNSLITGDAAGAMVLQSFAPGEEVHGMELLVSTIKSIGMDKVPGFYMPAGGR